MRHYPYPTASPPLTSAVVELPCPASRVYSEPDAGRTARVEEPEEAAACCFVCMVEAADAVLIECWHAGRCSGEGLLHRLAEQCEHSSDSPPCPLLPPARSGSGQPPGPVAISLPPPPPPLPPPLTAQATIMDDQHLLVPIHHHNDPLIPTGSATIYCHADHVRQYEPW
jgi:hypothetical protein